MAKDWESFKDEMIEFKIYEINKMFQDLENEFESPIERMAYASIFLVFYRSIYRGKMILESQKQIGPYKADIYLERHHDDNQIHKFVIECDGHEFHEKTKKQAAHDKKRDRYMLIEGFKVLRYTGSEIVNNPHIIAEDIFKVLGYKTTKD